MNAATCPSCAGTNTKQYIVKRPRRRWWERRRMVVTSTCPDCAVWQWVRYPQPEHHEEDA